MIRFYIAGTEICIEFGFVAVCALLSAWEEGSILLCGFSAVIVHELAHLIMMRVLSVNARKVTFHSCGIRISADMMCSYSREIAVLLAGPLVNITLWLFLSGFTGNTAAAQAQLICGFLNLMPSRFLDGGAALCAAVRMKGAGADTGFRLLKIIFTAVPLVLMAAGFFAGITNFTYYALMSYLLFSEILR